MPNSANGEQMKLTSVPGIRVLRTYERAWLPKDVVAGLVLTALLVPQGMAYAELAGLPPITGLYTSILCLTAYALMGPSRNLVLGPDSSLGPMIAATILPLIGANGDPAKAVMLASMLALLVGAIMLLAGLAHLGFIADLLSKPTQIGYMNGLALTILVGQLPKLFGFSVDADGFIPELKGFFDGLVAGETVAAALAIGVGALALILILERVMPKIPSVLVAVVLSIVAVNVFDLTAHGVSVVGPLPSGFPPFTIPHVSLSDVSLLLLGAFGIVFVALADTISTASSFAARAGDQVHGDQEMIGIGAANVAAGFFQGFPVSTSGSRTAVAVQAGAKSQVAGLVGAGAIVLMLVAVPGLLKDLPQPALAAVVISASLSLADVKGDEAPVEATEDGGVARDRRVPRRHVPRRPSGDRDRDGALDPERVPPDLVAVPGHPRRPVDDLTGFHDIAGHPDATTTPGLVLFRFDAPLIFANARTFRERVLQLGGGAGRALDHDRGRADHRCRHDRRRHAGGSRRTVERPRDLAGVRGDEGPGATARSPGTSSNRTIDPAHFYPTIEDAVTAFASLDPDPGTTKS